MTSLAALRLVSIPLGWAPPGIGQHALARRIHRRALAGRPPGTTTRQRMRGGAVLELDVSEWTQGIAFLLRRYEPAMVRLMLERLPRAHGVFFDVGAHVGLVSFQVAAARRSRGVSVHAFEPNPRAAGLFRRNGELNPDLDVRLTEAALGAAQGETTLAWPADRFDLAASFIPVDERPAGETARVDMITLDRYAEQHHVPRIHVLKLDVEGHELDALTGAAGLLSDGRIGCVVCELNDIHLERVGIDRETVVGRMAGWGYRLAPIPAVGAQRLRPRQADAPLVDVAFVRS